MLVSMNWIRDYVDLSGIGIEELIQRFTLSTAEVEDVFYKGSDVQGVYVAQIERVDNHPDSKKLHLLKISTGDRVYDCVCGAPNVAEGQKVAFVVAGGRLPGGEITEATVAGYPSQGMCCSEAELGISDDHSGLMELPDDLTVGADLCDVYPIRDVVFEVDNKSLTNRPDLWGNYGIAREFSAITGRPLKALSLSDDAFDLPGKTEVTIGREDLAYRYSCLKMENIKRTKSPVDMKIRLTYCGLRPINLLADLTNYIMLELGQPTHAFDAEKIDCIRVDTPKEMLPFVTLDGVERTVDADTLLIYNGTQPVAIAGIMGGLNSEIVGTTTSVLLESANFDGVCVRKSSSRLGLRTDSSMRYEKTLDTELTVTAIRRFVFLLTSVDPGARVGSGLSDVYVRRFPEIELSFTKAYVDRYTGINISAERILGTLVSLGFTVRLEGEDTFHVQVPSWRATKDVTLKADLIEEITRIYGYDNFEISTTLSPLKPVLKTTGKREEETYKELLVHKYALHEVHSYLWCDGKKNKRLGIEVEDNVRILNISTPENGTLRSSMLPTLLSFVYENRAFAPYFGLFEAGRVIDGVDEQSQCREKRRLGIVFFDKERTEKELYFHAVDVVQNLFAAAKRCAAGFEKRSPAHAWQHPKNTSAVMLGGQDCGVICTLHPTNLAKLDKNAAVVCVELDLDSVYAVPAQSIAFKEPSRFPSIDVDLSLVVDGGRRYAELEQVWTALRLEALNNVQVIDLYETEEFKSIAIRFSFGLSDRTMSMEEVQGMVSKIVEGLSRIGVQLRS